MRNKTRRQETVTKFEIKPEPIGAKPACNNGVTADSIRTRAYQNYETRMFRGIPGDELADWLEAEREMHASRDRV